MAEPISSRELVRAVAADFDRRGWSDEEELALGIATRAEQSGILDIEETLEFAGEGFLEQNGINRSELRAAIADVFAGRVLVDNDGPAPTFIDQSVTIGDNNTISGSINVGGNQLVLDQDSSPAELLSALGGFVTSGLNSGFSSRELELLDRLAESARVAPAELEDAVRTAIESAKPRPGRLAKFRDAVATSLTSGLVVKAILAVAAAL